MTVSATRSKWIPTIGSWSNDGPGQSARSTIEHAPMYCSPIIPFAACLLFLVFAFPATPARAQINVWVDFTTDLHDGNGGNPNGVADWIDELNQATANAAVFDFNAAERSTIESNIINQLGVMYSGYNVQFNTFSTGGPEERIYMGVESSALGFAPLDIGNMFTDGLGPANVAPASFSFFIESLDSRADQISEISIGLSGTAGHELGHSIGLRHHYTYSDENINPSNYGSTGGLQNQYVMATGSTGLGENAREVPRTFSPFSRVMIDISGGAETIFSGQDNDSLIPGGGILSDRSENNGLDAGSTINTAQVLSTSVGASSGLEIAFVEADLDGSIADVDLFELELNAPGTLLAHVFSDSLLYGPGGKFDPQLDLLDSNGNTLFSVDDVRYEGNTYDSGLIRTLDPFINNFQISAAGTYYLRVSAEGGAEVGSNYWLVSGFRAIPEPGGLGMLALLGIGLIGFRRRRRISD